MKTPYRNDERGIAHLALIVIAVVVLGVIGFAGWRVMHKSSKSSTANSLTDAIKQAAAKCDLNDKDLCKFMSSWKANQYYQIKGTTATKDGTETFEYQSAGTDHFHIVSSSDINYEMIGIGATTYTKDPSDGKWWKQTFKPQEESKYNIGDNFKFDESTPDSKTADPTTYKLIGKEACGSLQCFKYQVIDPSVKGQTEYIWFDTKDYQLRRTTTENADGKSDMTFAYDKVTVNEPSAAKEVGANQIVIPGNPEPMAMPSEADLDQMMQGLNVQ